MARKSRSPQKTLSPDAEASSIATASGMIPSSSTQPPSPPVQLLISSPPVQAQPSPIQSMLSPSPVAGSSGSSHETGSTHRLGKEIAGSCLSTSPTVKPNPAWNSVANGSNLNMASLAPPSVGSGPSSAGTKAWSAVVDNSVEVMEFHPVMELNNGNISVSIPSSIVQDAPPLWRNYVLGHFLGPVPHIGKIHAIVNKIWVPEGKTAKIDVNFLNESSALFRIDDDKVRGWVLKRLFWHIAEIPLVVCDWNPENARKKVDITSIPLWVDFKDVPSHLYSVKGLSYLASVIGKPIRLHPLTVKCIRLDVARVLVEVDLSKTLHSQILINEENGASNTIHIAYPWLPPRCETCNKWGHGKKTCSSTNTDKLKEVGKGTTSNSPLIPSSNLSLERVLATGTQLARTRIEDSVTNIIVPVEHKETESGLLAEDIGKASLSSKEVISDLILDLEKQNEWQVVHRGGSCSSNPIKPAVPVQKQSVTHHSPPCFDVLAKIREEGEIFEEEDSSLEINDEEEKNLSICDLEKKSRIQTKGKAQKIGKKQIIRSRDLALAFVSSSSKKRASLRKH